MSCISHSDFPTPQPVRISSVVTASKAEWVHFPGRVRLLVGRHSRVFGTGKCGTSVVLCSTVWFIRSSRLLAVLSVFRW